MDENIFKRYWTAYGGIKALFRSYYFYAALILTGALWPHWFYTEWWDLSISIMPSMLGFSLGGFAMWISLGDDNFRKLISGATENGKPSPFVAVSTAFVHFILLQMTSLIVALFADAYNFIPQKDSLIFSYAGSSYTYVCRAGGFVGYFIFIYALLSGVAATMQLLRVSSWYDMFAGRKK